MKIEDIFLSKVGQTKAGKIIKEFKEKVLYVALFPKSEINPPNHHIVAPDKKVTLLYNPKEESEDYIFTFIMNAQKNITVFVDGYGVSSTHEGLKVHFNGKLAESSRDNLFMALSHAKGEKPFGTRNLAFTPFEDKSKGWKSRIANGKTMWVPQGIPTRFQAEAKCIRRDGNNQPTETLYEWRSRLIALLQIQPEVELKAAAEAVKKAEEALREAKYKLEEAQRAAKEAEKNWGWDDPESVHKAEATLNDCLYDYGCDVQKKDIVEHYNGDYIAIIIEEWCKKGRFIFKKDGTLVDYQPGAIE
ncbi:hypothetical protein IJG04_00905 [Candidatus Saccharibacteria bacterium]|nr:hypothetical protein [Candidatus Saccharibacteria bacterium]